MLILLALLFANPFINRATPKAAGKKMVVVAVDHSFSMRAAGTSGRIAPGQSQTRGAERSFRNSSPATRREVVALGGAVQALTQQTTDPAELRGAVAAIQAQRQPRVFRRAGALHPHAFRIRQDAASNCTW